MCAKPYAILGTFIAISWLLVGSLVAQPATAEDAEPWTPPASEDWDWLHLNSGEWLKGEISYMRDRTIRFDSDELDELDNSYRAQVVATDTDKTSHHFESILSVDIWGPLDLDFTFMLDRIEKPDQNSDGERPDENDITILAGMSIDF